MKNGKLSPVTVDKLIASSVIHFTGVSNLVTKRQNNGDYTDSQTNISEFEQDASVTKTFILVILFLVFLWYMPGSL